MLLARPLLSCWLTSSVSLAYRGLATMSAKELRVALCQVNCTGDKQQNIATVQAAVREAARSGADLIALPECWNSPYDTRSFPLNAEIIPDNFLAEDQVNAAESPSTMAISNLAKEVGKYIIGGTVPERYGDKIYNTCVVFGPDGQGITKHRKIHLFDISIPGKITFKESDTLSAGDRVTIFETPWGKVGIGICYDIRFPELSMLMSREGCKILVYPGAFNLVTGQAHWELLQRARALDNQVFVCTISPARNPTAGYQAWGHSTVCDPWGSVIATTGHESDIVYAKIDMAKVEEVRSSIPVSKQKRDDIYNLTRA
ncbi:unnamed protein product [Chrysoparadoxa australica]